MDAYQRYYARRHTSRTRDYPELSTRSELQALIATEKWQYNEAVIEATLGLAEDGVIDRLQMHFYERWDAAPLLIEFFRSRIPADMPIEAWEVGLFDVDESKSEAALTEEVTKTVSQLLAYGVGAGALAAAGRRPERHRRRGEALRAAGAGRHAASRGRRLRASWSG